MQRAVFLDRDGVLSHTDVRNGKPYAPARFEDFEISKIQSFQSFKDFEASKI